MHGVTCKVVTTITGYFFDEVVPTYYTYINLLNSAVKPTITQFGVNSTSKISSLL